MWQRVASNVETGLPCLRHHDVPHFHKWVPIQVVSFKNLRISLPHRVKDLISCTLRGDVQKKGVPCAHESLAECSVLRDPCFHASAQWVCEHFACRHLVSSSVHFDGFLCAQLYEILLSSDRAERIHGRCEAFVAQFSTTGDHHRYATFMVSAENGLPVLIIKGRIFLNTGENKKKLKTTA